MKKGIFIAILPYLMGLFLFYSLAIHMHHSFNGWPKRIGTQGFSSALLIHDQIVGAYIIYLVLFTIIIVPVMILICLLVPHLNHLDIYFTLHLMLLPIGYGLM